MRSFAPHDFIQLPPLGEAGMLTLVEELEAAAHEGGLISSASHHALGRLTERLCVLKKAIATRERSGSAADPKARAADRVLDDAWVAFQLWLLGWTHLPEHAHARVAAAKQLYVALFPRGLQFLTLEFKDEWTQSQNRLARIADSDLNVLVEALGGGVFLENLRRAHRAYGEVLQITGEGSSPEPDAAVRHALVETQMALRDYVAQVAATARRDDVASMDVAARLLAPLAERAIVPPISERGESEVASPSP